MALSAINQAKEIIDDAKSILLITREHPTEDSIGSLLACGLFLEKMGKEIDLVCPSGFSSALNFLPRYDKIKGTLKSANNFVISLDTSHAKVAEFSYDFDEDGNKLNIYITPEKGNYNESHLDTYSGSYNYQAIITINTPDLERLGSIYEKHASLFFKTPIINIDNSSANENFGEVNLVDVKASSTSEVLYEMIKEIDFKLFDKNIATSLLTGITAGTQSFQNNRTTPKSFQVASSLIDHGADQQLIVKKIYKTKSLPALKLWGRVLARLKHALGSTVVWSLVTADDFRRAEATANDLAGALDEISLSVPDAKFIIIIYEAEPGIISGLIRILPPLKPKIYESRFNVLKKSDRDLTINFTENSLAEAEKMIKNLIKETVVI
ncbi:MAG: hypothetical protein ABIE68_03390 [bacterium]